MNPFKGYILISLSFSFGFICGYVIRKKFFECPPEPEPEKNPWKYAEKVSFNSKTIKGKIMSTTAQVKQEFVVTWPAPVDKYGNPASVENITFVSDDESLATIEAAPEVGPYSGKVKTQEKTGATAVRIKADGDVGEGVKEIEGQLAVEIIGGDAVGFLDPTATTPVDQTEEQSPEEGGEEGEGNEEILP
jgi:hypothetical protein